MKDIIFKLSYLIPMVLQGFTDWKEQIWDLELDSAVCCGGRDCGCQGSSHRQELEHYKNNPTKP